MCHAVISAEYLSNLSQMVGSIEYNAAQPPCNYERLYYNDIFKEEVKKKIHDKIIENGFCLVNFKNKVSPEWLSNWQESFLGELVTNKNPKGLPYSKVAIKAGSAYLADSSKAQPLHTDEGYTVNIPKYISLFCAEQAETGGISTLALIDNLINQFDENFLSDNFAFKKDAMIVASAHGEVNKPLFFYYDNDKVGIAYSPIVKNIKLLSNLKKVFELITEYIHQPKNQIRIKLEKGDLLIINNFRVLHGRTSFDNNSNRTFYRFWFGSKNILN